MIDVDARNIEAKRQVTLWLAKGRDFKPTSTDMAELAEAQAVLKNLIPVKANGFRGIVLTAIIGKYFYRNYDPLVDFYGCNPRPLFEKGIYSALREAGIPSGKSDPLNVAKNIQKLDYDWARGRRPETAARAVVDFLLLLKNAEDDRVRYEKLVLLYFHELYSYGQLVKSLNVEMEGSDETVPLEDGIKFAKFVIECPEGGSVPQFIVGYLIYLLREDNTQIAQVYGYDESVFGTNTTSKKPADVWEVGRQGEILGLYEVTVKVIDGKRLDDCVDSLLSHGLSDPVVNFICRLPQDIQQLNITVPFLTHRGVRFQFLDIFQFVCLSYSLLRDEQRDRFRAAINSFVADANRAIRTKQYWASNIC